LEFTKHANSRGGDAASIREHAASTVWGFVYRVSDEDRKRLREREKGYREISRITVFLRNGDDITPQESFTFQGEESCPEHCGPSREYLELALDGAKSRNLPDEYVRECIKGAISQWGPLPLERTGEHLTAGTAITLQLPFGFCWP
jgi:hypothetical protein